MREKRGGCIAGLSYVPGSEEQTLNEAGKLVWKYSFGKGQSSEPSAGSSAASPKASDLRQSGVPEGDLMVLSVDGENKYSPYLCRNNSDES